MAKKKEEEKKPAHSQDNKETQIFSVPPGLEEPPELEIDFSSLQGQSFSQDLGTQIQQQPHDRFPVIPSEEPASARKNVQSSQGDDIAEDILDDPTPVSESTLPAAVSSLGSGIERGGDDAGESMSLDNIEDTLLQITTRLQSSENIRKEELEDIRNKLLDIGQNVEEQKSFDSNDRTESIQLTVDLLLGLISEKSENKSISPSELLISEHQEEDIQNDDIDKVSEPISSPPLPSPLPPLPPLPPPEPPEPGPLDISPALSHGNVQPVSETKESRTTMSKILSGFSALIDSREAWNTVQKEKDEFVAKHVRGEYTDAEQRGEKPSKKAMVVGALVSAWLSNKGVAAIFDVPRAFLQKGYVEKERTEVMRAINRYAKDTGLEQTARDAEYDNEVRGRKEFLANRILQSRYLTQEQKQQLLQKVNTTADQYRQDENRRADAFTREVSRMLENEIRPRVSVGKAGKEVLNSVLAVSGYTFLRSATYGAASLVERYVALRRQEPDEATLTRLQRTVAGGFGEYFERLRGKKGRLSQAAAVATLARTIGFVELAYEGMSELELHTAIGEYLTYWSEELHTGLARANDAYTQATQAFSRFRESISRDEEDLGYVPDVSHESATDAHTALKATEESHELLEDTQRSAPDVPEGPRVDIPDYAIVRKEDGISQVIARFIGDPAHTHEFNRACDDEALCALFTKKMLAKEGMLDRWLAKEAIGKLSILPEKDEHGAWHIVFHDQQTRAVISLTEAEKRGWIIPAPK